MKQTSYPTSFTPTFSQITSNSQPKPCGESDFERSFLPETPDVLDCLQSEIDQALTSDSGPQVFRQITNFQFQRKLCPRQLEKALPVRLGAVITPSEDPYSEFSSINQIVKLRHQRFLNPHDKPASLGTAGISTDENQMWNDDFYLENRGRYNLVDYTDQDVPTN